MKRVISIVPNNFQHDSRVLKEAQSLQSAGYDVRVIALHDPGQQEHEVVGGIPVHRIYLKSRKWSKNRLIQVFKYVEWTYRIARLYGKADIFHCNDVYPLPIGIFLKYFVNRRAKVVYDAHELEFDKVEANSNYYPQWAQSMAERFCIRRSDAMMVVSPLIADAYVEKYGIEPPKVVMNCPEKASYPTRPDLLREKLGIRQDQKIFLYQGGLIAKRGVEILIETFADLSDELVLVFLGFGPLTDHAKEAARKYENIYYHPAVSPLELDPYTASADVGFCLYQGITRNHDLTIGNKIFQYIMAGLPVLASNLSGLKYILKDGMGIVVENFRNKDQIRSAILEIATWKKEDYRPRLQSAAQQYNWEAQADIMLELYKDLYA